SSLPIGILLASTFDPELVRTLYQLLGKEMKNYKIDVILGPGMNILRHPLNGRNFEYFSEDPLLTGIMGSSVVSGLQKEGVTGTLKHLFANNQETDRFNVNAVVSERAQREIYLKGFEIAIKAGKAKAIMTSYNPVNGLWTASLYDVNKLLVHDEWGFKGIIMTDWWAKMNDFGKEGDKTNTKAMIISQNDLYMVIQDAKLNSNNDNSKEAYLAGELKLAHLQKVAKNILSYLLTTPAFARMHHLEFKKELRTPNPWFNATETKIDLPLLKSIKIDGKTYDLNALNYLEECDLIVDFEKIESINGKKRLANYIEFNKDKSFGLVTLQNMSSSHIYYLRTKSNNFVSTDMIDLNTLENQSFDKVGEKVWTPIVLKLNEAIYNPSFVSNEDGVLSINQKDAVISFPLHFEQNGKYLVDFSLSSNASNLAQLPFSLYVDNSYKTTITVSGSNGEKIWARASMLVDAKKSALSIKFNKSDLKIYEIKVMRHG